MAGILRGSQRATRARDDGVTGTTGQKHTSGTDALARDIAVAYTVSHAGPVYLIDRAGRMRSLFTLPFGPEDLVHDMRVLMAESR